MNKISVSVLAAAAGMLFGTSDACAYPTNTHAAMTAKAVAASRLSDPTLWAQLGIAQFIKADQQKGYPFNTANGGTNQYVAISDDTNVMEGNRPFEQLILNEVRSAVSTPADFGLAGWVMRGAIREDDNDVETPDSDEVGGVFARVFAHFYDPYFDRGLTVFGFEIGAKTPEWALRPLTVSRAKTFDGTPRRNFYSLVSANEAMFRALTGLKFDGSDATPPNMATATSEDIRKIYWATTFRDLGDGVHLLQDMAQPQHTRNDKHSGLACVAGICAGGHDSFYEKYMGARTLGANSFRLQEGITVASDGGAIFVKARNFLDYGTYPAPTFKSMPSYYSSGTGDANATATGLANYSNRGFYTFGTNIWSTDNRYPSPDPTGLGLQLEVMEDGKNANDEPVNGTIRFLTGTVNDTYLNSPSPPKRLSTVGAWDQFLKPIGRTMYTLNYYNYDDQASLLVPRAVGYSTGLINHFFRGKLEISLPKEGIYSVIDMSAAETREKDTGGFHRIKMKIQNITPDVQGIAATNPVGNLRAVVKFHRNTCYKPDLSGEYGAPGMSRESCRAADEEIVVSNFIFAPEGMDQAPQDVTFDFFKAIPINATDMYLQVVYRGPLGDDQEALAIATKDIAEPVYLDFYDTREQFIWGPGPADTFTDYCAKQSPPIADADCRLKYGYSSYLRFTEPENFNPANPVASFNAVLSVRHLVGQYSRAAVLADIGENTTYVLQMPQGDTTGQYTSSTGAIPLNHVDSLTDSGAPIQYQKARGIYATSAEYAKLKEGDIQNPPDMSPITPAPSAINF